MPGPYSQFSVPYCNWCSIFVLAHLYKTLLVVIIINIICLIKYNGHASVLTYSKYTLYNQYHKDWYHLFITTTQLLFVIACEVQSSNGFITWWQHTGVGLHNSTISTYGLSNFYSLLKHFDNYHCMILMCTDKGLLPKTINCGIFSTFPFDFWHIEI